MKITVRFDSVFPCPKSREARRNWIASSFWQPNWIEIQPATNLSLSANQCLLPRSCTWHAIVSSTALRPTQFCLYDPIIIVTIITIIIISHYYSHHRHHQRHHHHSHHCHHHHRHTWAISNFEFLTLGSEQRSMKRIKQFETHVA